jgi:hypothetical protein
MVAGIFILGAATATAQPTDAVLCCSPDDDTVVAIVDNKRIRIRDLDVHSRSKDPWKIFELNAQLHDPREELLDNLENERALAEEAARLHVSVDVLLRNHLKVEPVTEADILEAFDDLNTQAASGEPPQDISLVDARPMIVSLLEGGRWSEARGRYIQGLRKEAKRAKKNR